MATTADFKNGYCIEFNGDIYTIVQFQHVKPGKGGAFVRTKLKSLTTGKVIDNTFNAGVKVEEARVERRPYQFLYKDDTGFIFMHNETFEQVAIQAELIQNHQLLKEGMHVEIVFHADTETPLYCDLPTHVEMEVLYTEPGLKGDTASSTATKPASLENDVEVMVPLFIKQGDTIKVDSRDMSYVERVKT